MHHHHPTTSVQASTTIAAGGSGTQAQQRRRKKRPNYGTRTVEVRRGYNGFGFTISGQQPCRLSCIVSSSPADQAGLRAGDFLISVNGLNVSKLPHETVVQLIGNSFGSIRMQIAENYYSDSSDEENAALMLQLQTDDNSGNNIDVSRQANAVLAFGGARTKPRYLHHRTKMHRLRNSPQKKRSCQQQKPQGSLLSNLANVEKPLKPLLEDLPLIPYNNNNNQYQNPPSSSSAASTTTTPTAASVPNASSNKLHVPSTPLEYRAVVGYLGTIEMPKQISHSSKLQTVRSCIRKLRQEKRQPTVVLMTILVDCLRLQGTNGKLLATYPAERLNYVSSSSESENRFFGLVTSSVHMLHEDDEDYDEPRAYPTTSSEIGHNVQVSISNSCHVFAVDTKLCEHQQHLQRASEFSIQCTRDPISNLCLEFPNNSEYVVNLIRSMYTMRVQPLPAQRVIPDATEQSVKMERSPNAPTAPTSSTRDDAVAGARAAENVATAAAASLSPQPSNHSEVSTTTSNSDSGIGFHNDCANLTDRILVVDFPGVPGVQLRAIGARPLGICNDKRLSLLGMSNPSNLSNPSVPTNAKQPATNLLANFNQIKSPAGSPMVTRSCEDVLSLMSQISPVGQQQHSHASMDDIAWKNIETTTTANKDATFLQPASVSSNTEVYSLLRNFRTGARYSLQPTIVPKVPDAQVARKNAGSRHSLGFKEIDTGSQRNLCDTTSASFSYDLETWNSLQNLNETRENAAQWESPRPLDITNSEPDLGNRALPANASPFRRAWGQSSFRTPRTDNYVHNSSHINRNSPVIRRTASMTASDNDVYIKSIDGGGNYKDDLKLAHSQMQIANELNAKLVPYKGVFKTPQIKMETSSSSTTQTTTGPTGVVAWGSSFERLLEDPAGLHTFAEFLKKEFSAENIYFWTACERFRHLENNAERVTLAKFIFDKHLANGAMEQVNVDSQARNLSGEKLQSAETELFAHAQKQIFNLMKFDSYPRFIRSELYKSCLDAEEKHQPLPYSAEGLDELLKINSQQKNAANLKKSASNAEDRRRKSLLPWHRKTRSKSRDRNEAIEMLKSFTAPATKLPLLSGSSLQIPSTQNSNCDLHSSRSSLSSFEALPGAISNAKTQNGGHIEAETICSLCRVILSDGATTIVQTRAGETVGQLVERLLEKRGLSYQFYDVVINGGSSKSIDLQSPSATLAGKEVLVEQRVAFKLDLPDPKVISVKSKPKKQLHEVIRPILQKYNYNMDAVQVLMRDTHTELDLKLPVTVADGKRLQIVLKRSKMSDYQNNMGHVGLGMGVGSVGMSKFIKPTVPKSISFPTTNRQLSNGGGGGGGSGNVSTARNGATPQSTLDEITNKVFNELLQGKVEAHAAEKPLVKGNNDVNSEKSDDCISETSSLFERIRRRDSNIPGFRLKLKKKSISSQNSEETNPNYQNNTITTIAPTTPTTTTTPIPTNVDNKKPIIAKLKAGVKLQVTERVAENQEELLEGLKRAQLARLEDQRGTEITFELPEFLKQKDQVSAAASKLRKVRANLSPVSKPHNLEEPTTPQAERPQPAPRLSIVGNKMKMNTQVSPMKIDEEELPISTDCQSPTHPLTGQEMAADYAQVLSASKAPPPLPPKPKVLPTKPSNWGVSLPTVTVVPTAPNVNAPSAPTTPGNGSSSQSSIDLTRKTHLSTEPGSRCAYLEEPSSSFV